MVVFGSAMSFSSLVFISFGSSIPSVTSSFDKKDIRHLKVYLEYDGPIQAPIQKDEEIGLLKILYNRLILSSLIM